ncbi:MAG: hypothetical protein QM756_11100 [Polyangiaceae bacterium]
MVPFCDDIADTEPKAQPRYVVATPAQDAAARAAGLSWVAWAERTLEAASLPPARAAEAEAGASLEKRRKP